MMDPLADETDEPILVTGWRGRYERDALIEALASATADRSAHLQAFDPGAVYGAPHLEAAARRALRAHREDRPIARDLGAEIACYAASTDQIDDALAAVGVPAEGDALVVCAVGEDAEPALADARQTLCLEPDEDVVDADEAALDRIGVEPAMREHVAARDWAQLAVEQVALLDARR